MCSAGRSGWCRLNSCAFIRSCASSGWHQFWSESSPDGSLSRVSTRLCTQLARCFPHHWAPAGRICHKGLIHFWFRGKLSPIISLCRRYEYLELQPRGRASPPTSQVAPYIPVNLTFDLLDNTCYCFISYYHPITQYMWDFVIISAWESVTPVCVLANMTFACLPVGCPHLFCRAVLARSGCWSCHMGRKKQTNSSINTCTPYSTLLLLYAPYRVTIPPQGPPPTLIDAQ